MSSSFLPIITGLAYIAMIAANALIGVSKNPSVYAPTYLQPDGVTFAVWGLIYLLLLIFVIFQYKERDNAALSPYLNQKNRLLATVSFFLNAAWLYINKIEAWWLSTFVLALYAANLAVLYLNLKVSYGKYSGAPLSVQLSVFSGVSSNLAWACAAACINFTNSGLYMGLKIETGPLYAVCVMVALALLASQIAYSRGDAFYTIVSAWALSGIARFQTHGSPHFDRPLSPEVVRTAEACILMAATALLAGFISRSGFFSGSGSGSGSVSVSEYHSLDKPTSGEALLEAEAQKVLV